MVMGKGLDLIMMILVSFTGYELTRCGSILRIAWRVCVLLIA